MSENRRSILRSTKQKKKRSKTASITWGDNKVALFQETDNFTRIHHSAAPKVKSEELLDEDKSKIDRFEPNKDTIDDSTIYTSKSRKMDEEIGHIESFLSEDNSPELDLISKITKRTRINNENEDYDREYRIISDIQERLFKNKLRVMAEKESQINPHLQFEVERQSSRNYQRERANEILKLSSYSDSDLFKKALSDIRKDDMMNSAVFDEAIESFKLLQNDQFNSSSIKSLLISSLSSQLSLYYRLTQRLSTSLSVSTALASSFTKLSSSLSLRRLPSSSGSSGLIPRALSLLLPIFSVSLLPSGHPSRVLLSLSPSTAILVTFAPSLHLEGLYRGLNTLQKMARDAVLLDAVEARWGGVERAQKTEARDVVRALRNFRVLEAAEREAAWDYQGRWDSKSNALVFSKRGEEGEEREEVWVGGVDGLWQVRKRKGREGSAEIDMLGKKG